MMPKGVEHLPTNRIIDRPFLVRIPMMPKGVEHLIDRGALPALQS